MEREEEGEGGRGREGEGRGGRKREEERGREGGKGGKEELVIVPKCLNTSPYKHIEYSN